MDCIALQLDEVPVDFHDASQRRLHTRDGVSELRFSFFERTPELPVIHEGQFRILKWGNKDKAIRLPQGGWCENEQLEAGRWQWLQPEQVTIPANFGRQSGRWYLIDSGVRGVLVKDGRGVPHVYVLAEPASHYYHIMARHDRMPLLVDQRI